MNELLTTGAVIPSAKRPMRELRFAYADALETHLIKTSELSSRCASDLGRWAIAHGVGAIKLARVHHASLGRILVRLSTSVPLKQGLRRAGEFLSDALSPYEQGHRRSRDALRALRELEKMEREMQRIALAIHDEAGQLLCGARLAISTAAEATSPILRQQMSEIAAILNRADQELRRISHDLRPTVLDDLGLVAALQFLAERVSRSTGISVRFDGSGENRFSANVEIALYRIVQEALTNVTRHSGAKNVIVALRHTLGKLVCLVHDDGVGFEPAVIWSNGKRGMGLTGIRERAIALGGRLQIHSQPRGGTQLLIEIPLKRRSGQSELREREMRVRDADELALEQRPAVEPLEAP